jgi:DNA ligase (NAD+)
MKSEEKDKKAYIEKLVKTLNDASAAYYNGEEEKMSNYEWDKLFDQLNALEKETGYILKNSPTQSVGARETTEEEKITHEFPALSLAKTKQISDLIAWSENKDIWLSWKLDGLTLVATYDNGKLSTLATRGNGIIGTNITPIAAAIHGLPLLIHYSGHLVVRGEAIITYDDFENFCLSSNDDYANPRNLASGSLSLKDIREIKKRNIQWFPFTLVYIDEHIVSWGDRMQFLRDQGFHPVESEKLHPDQIQQGVENWSKRVTDGEVNFPVDGLVIAFDDTDYAQGGTVTGHHAQRAGLAFKWEDESKPTQLIKIEWSCAASTITPIAIFNPVQLEGTIVKRATLHNISECERLGIGGEGTELKVIKANKIIPKIIFAKPKNDFIIPTECPVCHQPTKIEISSSGAKTLHCTNIHCPAKSLKKYERFVSRYGMDINSFSLQSLNKFINKGFIKNFADIFLLKKYKKEIINLDGFGEKSTDNLLQAIENSRKVKAENLLYALCIPMIGVDAARRIIETMGFEQFVNCAKNGTAFSQINGIGDKMSDSILQWFEKNSNEFDSLLAQLTITNPTKKNEKEHTTYCDNLTFVITGTLSHYKNRDALKAYILSQNGHVTNSISNKTDYLINNNIESKSSKNRKAKELKIPIITEKEFIQKFSDQ